MAEKEKTYVQDVDRSLYDFRNEEKDAYRVKSGLTSDIVEKISEEKKDPEWMRSFRRDPSAVLFPFECTGSRSV